MLRSSASSCRPCPKTTTTPTAPARGGRRPPSGTPTTSTAVEGEIPRDLDGIYLRNTENPLHPAFKTYHPFDGDGMLHVVGFRDGKAFYRNRFVRTDGFLAENEAGEPLWPGLAEPVQLAKREDGWGARTLMKDASSTDVIVHRGIALTSFYQCGDLYRVDPYSANTLGKETWNGRFPVRLGRVGASEGRQQDRRAAVLQLQQASAVHALRRGRREQRAGPLRRRSAARAAPAARHGVHRKLRDPQRFPAVLGSAGCSSTTCTCRASIPTFRRASRCSRAGATTGDIRWFEADPTFVLHFVNAYEDGDEIVLDGFFEGDPQPLDTGGTKWEKLFRFLALDRLQTRLHRWRFNLVTGAVKEEQLSESITEFGTINPDYASGQLPLHLRRHRQAGLVPVRRLGQTRPAHRQPGGLSRSATVSTAARPRWRRGSAQPVKTTATWSP